MNENQQQKVQLSNDYSNVTYHTPSNSFFAKDGSVSKFILGSSKVSRSLTMERTCSCFSGDAFLPLLVNEIASIKSDRFFAT